MNAHIENIGLLVIGLIAIVGFWYMTGYLMIETDHQVYGFMYEQTTLGRYAW